VIAVSAVFGFVTLFFMTEPKGHIAEVNENGEVTLISVS
jgi:NNP family nitrate/nitrite transporter-like MFS transporter